MHAFIKKIKEGKTMENQNTQKLADLILSKLEISIRKFCKEIKISRPTIDNIINDRNHEPTLLTVKKICNYFEVDYKDYL